MRIKDYTDMVRHLTDSFNIPEARRIIAENPALTQEQFKAGGIVEPGVTHYANPEGRSKIKISDFTSKQKANLKTWIDNTGSTLEDYNKKSSWNKNFIKEGRVTGIRQTEEFGKTLEGAKTKEFRNWLSKQDPKTLTADSVDDLIRQTKINITSRTRPGLIGAIRRIMEEKEFAKFKNIELGRIYSQENINQLSDDLLKAYAEDDITLVMDPKHKPIISNIRSNRRSALDKAIKNTGLDEETIFNLLDDRDAYVELELKQETTKGRPVEKGKAKFYKQAENWIIENSKRYEDPDKFKKAFTRTFGRDNHLIQQINKGSTTSIPFSDWFRTTIMGSSEQAMRGQVKPAYDSSQLDTIFKTAIYTNNENVRNKITKEIKNILPESASRRMPDIRKALNESSLLKKFGLNFEIKGPIARLLAKEIGDDLVKKISLFRHPWMGTPELLTYLKDIVDPKYKSMFEESIKAVKYAQKNQWPEAKKALNLSQSIMFDHKVPKALIGLGYADEIEYIKLHPTSAQFNAIIKNSEFDKPLVKLTKKWEEAKTLDAKAKVVGEMNTLKDNFSKKYGGYLDEVRITLDKTTGKPMFSSTADVVTKDTDLVKSLKTSLAQEKGFKDFNKIKQSLASQIQNMDGDTLAQFKKFYPKCFDEAVGGNALRCLTKQANKNTELFVKNSVSIGKATEGTKVGTKIANFLTKIKPFLRGTGWVAAGEAAIAPIMALGPYARGKTGKRMASEAFYGIPGKWTAGLAQSEYEEIKENAGQMGADVWKMKQIDVKRDELFKDYTALMEYQTGKPQSIDNLQRSAILQEKLGQLSNEYSELSQQFLSGEVDAEGNPIGNELYDTAMNNLLAGTKQIERLDKQRVGERQQMGKKIGRTLMDKPREKFIDFTLGPNWKENLPQYPSSTQYPHSPTTLGQHLSSDTNLPLFREGGIASLLKK